MPRPGRPTISVGARSGSEGRAAMHNQSYFVSGAAWQKYPTILTNQIAAKKWRSVETPTGQPYPSGKKVDGQYYPSTLCTPPAQKTGNAIQILVLYSQQP